MNDEESKEWSKLSRALFGATKTADEALFVQNVMRGVRRLQSPAADVLWPRFMRWAVPTLGIAMASFLFALQWPLSDLPVSTETFLSEPVPPEGDYWTDLLEDNS